MHAGLLIVIMKLHIHYCVKSYRALECRLHVFIFAMLSKRVCLEEHSLYLV